MSATRSRRTAVATSEAPHRRLTDVATQPFTQPAIPLAWPITDEAPARLERRSGPRRVLVAGVGYRNLRDLSVGPELADRLRTRAWPPGVQVEDLSFGAVHVLHWLRDQPPFDAAVFLTAATHDAEPGHIHQRVWTAPDVTAEAVQSALAEAVTGVISLDTLLIVLGYFEALPPRVIVIEVEPRDEDWGPAFSPAVQTALDEVEHLLESLVQ